MTVKALKPEVPRLFLRDEQAASADRMAVKALKP